jgi:hypothetical protein
MARTGMTIDERGGQGLFGDFARIAAAGSHDPWIGRLAVIHNELTETHGQKLNNRFIALRTAKTTTTFPPPAVQSLPERQKDSVIREKRLAQLEQQKNAVYGEIFDLQIGLTPFDYAKEKISEAKLARLNDKFARMDKDERASALKDREFRMAVLNEPHQMSAMPKSEYDMLRQSEIERRFPNESARVASGRAAIAEIELDFKTVQRAHAEDKQYYAALAESTVLAEDTKKWA